MNEQTNVKLTATQPAGGTPAPLAASQPRREDGSFHSAATASDEADCASGKCETKTDHQAAAKLHDTAQTLQLAAGNQEKAEHHRIKAQGHRDCANAMNASAPAEYAPPAPPAEYMARLHAMNNVFGAAARIEGATAPAPLEASFDVPAPVAFDAFMVMPAGVHTVRLTRLGRPHTVTVNVNAAGARARQAQLEAVNAQCQLKAYNCFDHERKKASSHPLQYWWEDGANPRRPAGIYERAEPTKSGLEAVAGKDYQGWSETFWVDNEFAGPEQPAQLRNPLAAADAGDPNNYRVMGTMTNQPAFVENAPLFAAQPSQETLPSASAAARPAGAPNPPVTTATKTMEKNPLDAAQLQQRIEKLEQDIAGLEAKDDGVSRAELRAARSEIETRTTQLRMAEQNEQLKQMHEAEHARLGVEADKAIAVGVEAALVNPEVGIPQLDAKAKQEWREKFIKAPTLIPLMASTWGAVAKAGGGTGRARQGVTATGLEAARFGQYDVTPGPVVILKSMNQVVKKMRPVQGLDASDNKKRTLIANDFAQIWAKEVRGPLEADGEGGLRPTMKTEFLLAPFEAALDAADFADPLNNLGTLTGTFVAQRYLDIFMYKLPMISNGKIMTDFSDQPSDLNQTVTTRKILIPAVQSFDNTLSTDGYPNGWDAASAAQTTDVTITLDELVGVPIPFSMATLSQTQRQLFMEAAPAASYAMAKYYLAKLYKKCTAATFNAYAAVTAPDTQGIVRVPTAYPTYACALIDFARSKIADVAAAFDANEVPDEDRSVLLNAAYYNKATTDPSLVTFFAGQQAPEIVTQGTLPDLAGFVPIKAPNFPGTNNGFGIFLQKNGLLAKSRLPANLNTLLPGAGNGSVTQIVHPETGLAMLLIQFVDHKRGYTAWLPCAILGAATGDTRGGLVGTTQ